MVILVLASPLDAARCTKGKVERAVTKTHCTVVALC
jgi:hypothetical protein